MDGDVDGDGNENAENEEINIAIIVDDEVNVMETQCPICRDVLSMVYKTKRGENVTTNFVMDIAIMV